MSAAGAASSSPHGVRSAIVFAVEATRRWAAGGITSDACMPGGSWTGLQRHWDPEVLARVRPVAAEPLWDVSLALLAD